MTLPPFPPRPGSPDFERMPIGTEAAIRRLVEAQAAINFGGPRNLYDAYSAAAIAKKNAIKDLADLLAAFDAERSR